MDNLDCLLKENQMLDNEIIKVNKDLKKDNEQLEYASKFMVNIGKSIAEIDKEFAAATGLGKVDITFMFLALALQCMRQYIVGNDNFRLTDKQGDGAVKGTVKKVTSYDKLKDKNFLGTGVTVKEVGQILTQSVPYDAVKKSEKIKLIEDTLKIGGTTHRYRTLGHDPLAGWIFGTANIMTDSLTKTDFITTYKVENHTMQSIYKMGTLGMLMDTMEAAKEQYVLPAAIGRQLIHFGSDYFTKQGLPIPVIATVDNDFAKMLVTKCSIDTYSVTRGAALAALIDWIIAGIHGFLYNENMEISRDLYKVKTKKIITLSDLISSASNVIVVGTGVALGNEAMLKKLDIGGISKTLWSLHSNIDFINDVKKEFIMDNLLIKWNTEKDMWRMK